MIAGWSETVAVVLTAPPGTGWEAVIELTAKEPDGTRLQWEEGWDMGNDDGGVEQAAPFDVYATSYFFWDSPVTSHIACASTGVAIDRAVEFDWLRFFWDADNKLGLDVSHIMDAWVEADPVHWDEDGSDSDPLEFDPKDEMEAALVDPARLTQTEWNNWAGVGGTFIGNGVDQ